MPPRNLTIAALIAGAGCTLAQTNGTSSPSHPQSADADRIIDAVLEKNGAWAKLEALCDGIGHRLSGSAALDRAIDWAVETMQADGHENVAREPVQVPRWVRGDESLQMNAPRSMALPMLALGGSVGTPPDGITAAVVVVGDEDGLKLLGAGARGRIVLFDNPMPDYDHVHGSGYGTTVRFRTHGARMAAAQGAVAVLVRSVTATSLRTPHTGATRYGDAPNKIPAAAITAEDSAMIARLVGKGTPVEVTLKMEARTEADTTSANVVAELRGRELPDEIVVIGGHIDSWDVGQGAHDDGAGCVIAMEALTALRKLDLRPRRTIRVVLFTNEENGLGGARAYAKMHASELANHVAAIESDSGAFAPVGFGVDMLDEAAEAAAAAVVETLLPMLWRLGPQRVETGFGGADLLPMVAEGVTALGLDVDGSRYFDYHHSPADTLDKVDPAMLSKGVAAMAVMAYVLAEMPGRLYEAAPAAPAAAVAP